MVSHVLWSESERTQRGRGERSKILGNDTEFFRTLSSQEYKSHQWQSDFLNGFFP